MAYLHGKIFQKKYSSKNIPIRKGMPGIISQGTPHHLSLYTMSLYVVFGYNYIKLVEQLQVPMA